MQEYSEEVQFLLVYIAESHAVDEWPVGETIIKKQHRTVEDRIEACKECLEDFGLEIPCVVDTIENDFHTAYSCWPIRFYCIKNGILDLVARYNIKCLFDCLPMHHPVVSVGHATVVAMTSTTLVTGCATNLFTAGGS